MTKLPRITITRHDGGWLAACADCGWLLWHQRRPAADLGARDHKHGTRQRGND